MKTKTLMSISTAILCVTAVWAQQPQERIDSIQGKVLYKAYCATCHGTDARGNGPMAAALRVPPPDLTRYAARNGGIFFKAKMNRIILGEDQSASHGSSEMPIWGPIFSEVDEDRDMGRVRVDNLVRYLETLQAN